jgi:hypothetical protein
LKTDQKPVLTESPFVKKSYSGANNKGFWNSFHMSLQFERRSQLPIGTVSRLLI